MSLTKCRECGNQVSTTASVCPQCGAKVRKPTSLIGVAVVVAALLLFFQCSSQPAKQTAAPKTPEQIARQKADEDRFTITAGMVLQLRKAMRNPASFQLEEAYANDDATLICVRYRGQNGFGGMNVETAIAVNGVLISSSKDWNKRCAGVALHDMKHVRHAIPN